MIIPLSKEVYKGLAIAVSADTEHDTGVNIDLTCIVSSFNGRGNDAKAADVNVLDMAFADCRSVYFLNHPVFPPS